MNEILSSAEESAIRDSGAGSSVQVEATVVLVIISVVDRSSGFEFKDVVSQSAFVLDGGLFVPLLKVPWQLEVRPRNGIQSPVLMGSSSSTNFVLTIPASWINGNLLAPLQTPAKSS